MPMTRTILKAMLSMAAVVLLLATKAGCGQPEGAGSVSILKAKEAAAVKGIAEGPSGDEAQLKKRARRGALPKTAAPKGGR